MTPPATRDKKGKTVKRVITKLAVIGLPTLIAAALAVPTSASAATGRSTGSAATVGAGSMAVPATAPSQCPSGSLCFWVDAGYVGKMGKVSGNNGSWAKFSESQCAGGTWNDCASALVNHKSGYSARVYKDNNGGGGGRCVPYNTEWSNLQAQYFDNGIKMNDNISSNDWITGGCS